MIMYKLRFVEIRIVSCESNEREGEDPSMKKNVDSWETDVFLETTTRGIRTRLQGRAVLSSRTSHKIFFFFSTKSSIYLYYESRCLSVHLNGLLWMSWVFYDSIFKGNLIQSIINIFATFYYLKKWAMLWNFERILENDSVYIFLNEGFL